MENSRLGLPPCVIDVRGLICSGSPPRPSSTTSVLGQRVTWKSCFTWVDQVLTVPQISLCEQLMWCFTQRPHQSGSSTTPCCINSLLSLFTNPWRIKALHTFIYSLIITHLLAMVCGLERNAGWPLLFSFCFRIQLLSVDFLPMPLSIASWISVTVSFTKNKLYVHKVIVQGKKLQEEKWRNS